MNILAEDIEITSTEEENCYQEKISPTNRIKTKYAFNNQIDKIRRMEQMTIEINKAIKNTRNKKFKPKVGAKCNTSGDLFKVDMKWLMKANPLVFEKQKKHEDQSKELYYKMRERRLIKERLQLSGGMM